MSDSATQRLAATAIRLFQERGLARVGINEIIREADVARMSLYNNFGSKADLAIAVYSELSKGRQEAIDAAIQASDGPAAAILAIFDLASELAEKPSFRGCAFLNLAAQVDVDDHQLLELVRRHKRALRGCFERLAIELGHPEPEILGRQLLALWDGALADAFIEAGTEPILAARAVAARLIEATH
jgi:AcrR family transcriptional regulator